MPIGPTLETKRLILRPPAAEDFEAFCEMYADEETMTYLGGVQPPELVWRSMRTVAGNWSLDGFSFFSVIEKSTGNWIGRLGPWHPHGWPGTEVGWGLIRTAWGKGYATEGAAAAMDYAFSALGWETVIHTILPENLPSIRLAERLGSVYLNKAPTPPPFEGMVWDVYGQTADEWASNRKALITPA